MEKQIDYHQTTDIKTSAYILSEGISVSKIITDNPEKIIFCFPNTQKVKDLLKRYWTNRASTNPRLLFDNFDYLKGLVHRNYQI